MYDDRTNLGQLVARDVREFFKDKVFNTIIPRNVRLGEAPSHGIAGGALRREIPRRRGVHGARARDAARPAPDQRCTSLEELRHDRKDDPRSAKV